MTDKGKFQLVGIAALALSWVAAIVLFRWVVDWIGLLVWWCSTGRKL